MKALEKDRASRYDTATGFANDIERYLNDEAVVACPPSRAYRFQKFVRRNKVALISGTILAVALLLGLAGTTWQMVSRHAGGTLAQSRYEEAHAAQQSEAEQRRRAEQERERANSEADRAFEAAVRAEREAAITKALNDFLCKDLLAMASPDNEPDRDIKLPHCAGPRIGEDRRKV